MKIAKRIVSVERGGNVPEESFGIGNLGRILVVLRSKMYSNPIRSICREISCNARDAHREVGTPEKPIQIHLPNVLDSHFKVKDWGPGITPDRMSNVFLLYGNTTKDQSNQQTGGFGLGAKTPFAYADQFSIVTTTPEADGTRTKRSYVAYIDESEEGKMRLVSVQKDTDEPCGTEISLLVKEKDWQRFADETIRETRFWSRFGNEPRPELTGVTPSPEYPEDPEPMIESETWAVLPQYRDRWGYSGSRTSHAIVDGIGYDIDIGSLGSEESEELLHRGVELYFKVGDVGLTANREALDYDDQSPTRSAIEKRLREIRDTAVSRLTDKLAEADSFTDACRIYCEFKSVLGCALPDGYEPKWQGHKCSTLTQPTRGIENLTVQRFYNKTDRHGDVKVFKDDIEHVSLEENAVIYVNDVTRVNVPRDRVRKILEAGGDDLKYVYVLTFADLSYGTGLKEGVLPLLDITQLSTIPRTQRARAPRGSRRNTANAYEFDPKYRSPRRHCDKYWRPCDVDRKDGEGVYVIIENYKQDIRNGNTHLSQHDVRRMHEYVEGGVYAVKPADAAKLGKGWIPFTKALREVLDEKLEELDITLEQLGEILRDRGYRLSEQMDWLARILTDAAKKKQLANGSLLKEYHEKSGRVAAISREYADLWELSRFVQPGVHKKLEEEQKDPELQKMLKQVMKRYPLLEVAGWHSWRIERTQRQNLLKYIQMVDAEEERKANSPAKPKKRSLALKRSVALKRSAALRRMN